ncbi:MAG TPA: hypothetical protein VI701_02150 [Anaerolineales bacterium]|nr:hypothetical protein [Anaerolineales bacterium]
MCQTENAAEAEFCRLCHAKLPEAPEIPSVPGSGAVGGQETPAAGGEMPDWLSRLRQEVTGEAGATESAPLSGAGDDLDWLGAMPQVGGEDEGPPAGEVPEWLGASASGETSTDETPEGADVPEWLAKIRAKARGEDEGEPAFEVDEAAEITPAPPPVPPSAPEAVIPVEPEARSSLGLPDWLMAARPDEAPTVAPSSEPERPSWLMGVTDDGSGELPRIPALVFDGEGAPPPPALDIDLSSVSAQVPDWMGEGRPPEAADRSDLAPATLPAWLEAMRPVDTFRSVIEIESAEDAAVESAGPLAGLRGALLAEPVVAMPHAPTGKSARLDVNERQYAQAELLHRLIEDEQREVRPRPAAKARPSALRWVVAAALLLAVGVPGLLGVPAMALPAFAPRDLAGLVGVVDAIPTERPALIVFDYEAGATGEMEAVAGPFLSHLMARGVPIATLSTHAGGSVLAERLMALQGAGHNYVRGEDFIHLGYLPGGPAAVQLFAASPRQAVTSGFLKAEALTTIWDSPVLAGVTRLSDFTLLAVITSGSEDARVWIEQSEPFLGEAPLVTVVSAGSEPLVRPYYESTDPRVNGILSGLTSAVAYEQRLGEPGLAHSRWSSYGLGLLVAEVLIVMGAVGGIATGVVRSRRR